MSDLGNKEVMAENLKRFMNMYGTDRHKMADDLGFSYTTLSSWIQAKNYPRIDKIEMMANYFNVSKADLVERYNPSAPKNTVDIADPNVIKTFEGREIPEEDLELIKRLLRGKE